MKFIAAVLLFITLSQTKAQEKAVTENLLTATILSPGISYEIATGNRFTVKLKAAVFPAFSYSSGVLLNGRSHFSFTPTPLLSADGRYYYNFKHRAEARKNINRNSANYFALSGKYGYSIQTYYPENGATIRNTTTVYDAGVVWGLQRNYKNRFSIDFNIGPSILNPLINQEFGLLSNLSLGIWLSKRTE